MTSSTITGERKWASARRGGMTVLGKVAVPKPINLPSQRLENHGLDPNVEIVPKGTLSWGSRSSPGSNAWGMSALSPSGDGSSSSPSQLVGRPSSGGGTRPSTAGSEIAHDSNVNAWSSNSRPSSASGSSASNNVSLTSLRPRSADTRPGSSQLSRFAERSPEISGAWGSNATSERIGLGNSGKDGFSLSSGDFPTLGSEKDESRKNTESLDHASYRDPGVSSGVTTITESMENAHRDDISRNADSRGSSWRKDGLSYVEDGPRPSMERCYGEPLPYQNPNMAPHYESWRGPPPVNPAGPVWYRGPPGPPPYGAPGGFPMEPFPYYPPQVPAPGLANSQAVPPRGAGPRGHYSTNGDMYRPHMSESYMRPGMPMRPGFYPAPVPYEGYYGPPMAFCNPSDRDLSFMGMPTGPPVYNRPINPNVPDPKHLHSRPGEVGAPEQVEPRHPNDPRENSKVLRKQNDHWRNQNDEQRWAYRGTNAPNHEKGILSKPIIQNNAWEDDYKKDEDVHFDKNALVERSPPRSIENKFGSSNSANVMFPGGVSNLEDTDLHSVMENVTSPVDHSLIQKIEGLNAKARAPGGRQDSLCSDEQHDGMQIVNAKANQSATDANSDIVLDRHYPSGVLVPVSHDIHFGTVDRSREIMAPVVTSASRKPARGAQSRGNHGKGSFIGQEADGWRERSESHTVVSPAGSGSNIKNQVVEHHAVVHPAEVSEPNIQKGDEESVMPIFDPSDAQRAKMKEIAKQRAIQLQKEEEERIRDQMAKALAKLEELNRRSAKQVAENPGHTVDGVPPHNVAPLKQEDPRNQIEPRFNANRSTKSTSASAINFVSTNERVVGDNVGSTVSSMPAGAETEKTTFQDSILSQNQLPTADLNVDNAADQKTTRQKRVGNKQRQNIHREKNSTLETIPAAKTDMTKDHKDSAGCEEVAGGEVAQGAGRELAESPYMPVSAVHQKKKSNGGKSNNKVEELPTGVSPTRAVAKESNNTEAIPGTEEHNTSSLNITSSSIQSSAAKDVTHTSENHTSLSHEDAHSRQNNSWKSQHSRKPRNSQGNRSEKYHNNDAVVWAPVRLQNKVEATDQTGQKAAVPSAPSVTGDDLVVNNSPKTKRAEMERYVPKPVAKELAQGSIQQSPSPSVDQAATNGTEGRVKASRGSDYLAKAGSTVESKHVDGKHRPRAQGTWCQRGSAESIPVQASQDSSFSAVVIGKNIETPNGCGTVKSDETLIGGPPSRSDHEFSLKGPEINACDGWNSANDSGFSSSAFAGGEDNVLSGKGKRHSFKGHKGTDNNQYFDRKGLKKAGLTNLQHPPIGTSQTERTVPLKENKAVGEHAMSHWQPKAQGSVTHNQQGNRSQSCQSFVTDETSKTMKRETSDGNDSHNLSQCNQGAAGDRILSEGKDLGGGISSSRHQENKMDKSVASVRGRAYSSIQGSFGEVATGPFNAAEHHDEQRPSSGYRKNANHGGRFGKGLESRGDWNSTGQENKQHYLSGNRERHRPNAHFEYQPVDPYNRSSDRPNDYGQQTENQPGGPKFRGRGQSHARRDRGNFYGRQRGSPADAGNE